MNSEEKILELLADLSKEQEKSRELLMRQGILIEQLGKKQVEQAMKLMEQSTALNSIGKEVTETRRLDKSISGGYTENRKGAAGRRLAPSLSYRSNRRLGAGRLLLFIGRNKEADNADDNKTVCKHIRVSHHMASPPFRGSGGEKLPPVWRPTACRCWQR